MCNEWSEAFMTRRRRLAKLEIGKLRMRPSETIYLNEPGKSVEDYQIERLEKYEGLKIEDIDWWVVEYVEPGGV
jgi:hypothetical protein